MIDKDSRDAYQSIRLQRDLRPDILERHTTKRRGPSPLALRMVSAFACLALITGFVLVSVFQKNAEGVFTGGERITANARSVSSEPMQYIGAVMRLSVNPTNEEPQLTLQECIELSLKYKNDVCVTVSAGMLLVPRSDGILLFSGQSGCVAGTATVYWSVDNSESLSPLTAEITSPDGKWITSIQLTLDPASNSWFIAQQ